MGSTLAPPAFLAFAPRTVIVDEDQNPVVSEVRPGGILVWSNRSKAFPHFALVFDDHEGRGPASPGDTLAGFDSIVIHVVMGGTFYYSIQFSPGPDSLGTVTRGFSVHSCVHC